MVLAPNHTPSSGGHHQKRRADHHKRTKPYHKPYWPYLPMLAVAGLAFGFHSTLNYIPHLSGSVLGVNRNLSSQQLTDATNLDRYAAGLDSLANNPALTAAAQQKAQDMVSRNYWSHDTPDGHKPWDFAAKSGYDYQALAENLAYGFQTPASVIQGWQHSQAHRSNMLDPAFTDVGFGVVKAANYQGKGPQTVIVALYGNPQRTADVAPVPAYDEQRLARADLWFGKSVPGVVALLLLITAVAVGYLVFRHVRVVHNAVVKGEQFVIHHPWLDLLIVLAIAAAVVSLQAVGFTK